MSPREGKGISLLIMLSDTYETHLIDSVCGPPEGTALLLLYYTKAHFILYYHGKNYFFNVVANALETKSSSRAVVLSLKYPLLFKNDKSKLYVEYFYVWLLSNLIKTKDYDSANLRHILSEQVPCCPQNLFLSVRSILFLNATK